MKKLILVLMIICLAGCAGTQVKPPTGCDNSLVWKSGFMPDGQELVELGFAALLTADPSLMPQVKTGAIKGWQLAKDGTLKGAVTELLGILNKVPQCAPLAAFALQRLAHITGDPAYGAAAARTLDLFHAYLRRVPHAVPSLLAALEEHVALPHLVVLRGPEPEVRAWQKALTARFDPHRIVLALPGQVDGLPPFLSHPATARVAAYVCVGTSCRPAILSLDELHAALA